MEVQSSYLVPRQVLSILQYPGCKPITGIVQPGGYCWVLYEDQLHFWRYQEAAQSRLRSLRVPAEAARHVSNTAYVSIISPQHSGATTVLLCTPSGHLCVWLDANYLSEPVVHQLLPGSVATISVTGFSAHHQTDGASGPAFVAAASCSGGSWVLVHGSSQGIYTRQLGHANPQQEPKGVMGKLGSVISWTYTEAFDPLARLIKKSPSGRPAVAVQSIMIDTTHLKVFVLSEVSLDCWLVTLGLRPAEQLLWSYLNTQAVPGRKQGVCTNLALAASSAHVYVLLQDSNREGGVDHILQRVIVGVDCPPVSDWTASLPTPALDLTQQRLSQLCCSALADQCLVLPGPGRPLIEVLGPTSGEPRSRTLSTDPDILAVAAGQGAGGKASWVVLSATYGVVDVAAGVAEEPQYAHRGTTPLTAEQEQQVITLLDASVNQGLLAEQHARLVGQQPQALLGLVAGLQRRLEGLGAFSPVTNSQVFGRYSTHVVDLLPKQWAAGGAAATTGGVTFTEHLAEKEARHNMLLACLAEGGILHRLPPSVQGVLLENAEKLAVASAMLQMHDEAEQDRTKVSKQLMNRAGQLSSSGSGAEVLGPTEMFFARPSISTPALIQALGESAASVCAQAESGSSRPGDEGAHALSRQLSHVQDVLARVVGAAEARREAVQHRQRLSAAQLYAQLGAPGWLEGAAARQAVGQVAQACQAVRQQLGGGAAAADLARPTFKIVDVLLRGFAAAVVSSSSQHTKEELLGQYQATRQRYVSTLLEDALVELRARRQQQAAGSPPPQEALIWKVEELCRAHHCYPQLYAACEALSSTDPGCGPDSFPSRSPRLHQHMLALTAEEGVHEGNTFARWVFTKLLSEGRSADLLLLPPDFHPGLKDFLQPHPQLLYLQLLRAGEFAEATATLQQAAAGAKADQSRHKRLLCLAKLSAHASGTPQAAAPLDTQLQLLQVQEQLGLGAGSGSGVLDVTSLVEQALQLAQQQQQQQGCAAACSTSQGAMGLSATPL
mmetsp:Transcript_19311/g.41732  ORF Transcript_19311/g.41732 Transcript_19311/m.41732 type:complete len:1007 (-) Transcript_19311:157-3177(-)